jgi:tRNA threonylcarbamoyladenosine biosynthesis protein TsaE
LRYVTHSPKDTRSLGEKLGKLLRPGDVLVLRGEMGTGKSELTRGIAKGLQVDGTIASPTFTILQAYDTGKLPLYHFDWYRVDDPEELYDIGADEYLSGDGVSVVEWPERAPDILPEAYLQISLAYGAGENERVIEITPVGSYTNASIGKDIMV